MLLGRAMRQVGRFWAGDEGLSAFLMVLLFMAFVVPALAVPGRWTRLLVDVFFLLLVVTGAGTVWRHPVARNLTVAAAVVALAIRALAWSVEGPAIDVLNAASMIVTTGLLALLVLGQVLRAGPVNRHRIEGAIAGYVLLGVTWAETYNLVYVLDESAFRGVQAIGRATPQFLYFSFITLATVGYGDIIPVHPAARSLAAFEALTGQLYIAILLARLVSLVVIPRHGGEGGAG